MVISPDILRKTCVELLTQIDAQIGEVKKEAHRNDIRPEQVRDAQGNWAMSPLLLAKVQIIATLAGLNEPRKPK